jgi:hypothetical protein
MMCPANLAGVRARRRGYRTLSGVENHHDTRIGKTNAPAKDYCNFQMPAPSS